MEKYNKKGFTLVELLAVIVVLAIIALITIPVTLNIIENARKGAFEDGLYIVKFKSKLDINSIGKEEYNLKGHESIIYSMVLFNKSKISKSSYVGGRFRMDGCLNRSNNNEFY